MKPRNFFRMIIAIAMVWLSVFHISAGNRKALLLDLAANKPGTTKVIKGNYMYDSIIFENTVYIYDYNIEISNEKVVLPALSLKDVNPQETNAKEQYCENLKQDFNILLSYLKDSANRNEGKISKLVKNLNFSLNFLNCNDSILKVNAQKVIESTKIYYDEPVEVKTGTRTTIVVKRDTLVWTFVLQGEEIGKWITSYGFGFSSAKYNGDSYVTKQLQDTALYQIIKSKRPQIYDLNYIPAVFFSYFPSLENSCGWNCSYSAGLGYDLAAPVLFAGYNVMYRYNIGLSLGVVFQQQYRLKDQYSENQIISVSLDQSQLHDKIYRPNIYLAVHFRFGENPFKAKQISIVE